jgi:adenosylcobyric acid synthase
LRDPEGIEGTPGTARGLAFLDAVTTFGPRKRTRQTRAIVRPGAPGFLATLAGEALDGYEIHAGTTSVGPGSVAFLDGCGAAASPDGRVVATYLHGLFDNTPVLAAFVNVLRRRRGLAPLPLGRFVARARERDAALDALASALRRSLDVDAIYRIALLAEPGKANR